MRSSFFIKLSNREYWPMWANYLPVFPYYLWLSIRERSFFWFSATNPSIETGGMIGESKIDILDKIPSKYKPTSLFFKSETPLTEINKALKEHNISFPFVVKPDVGERGTLVEKINTSADLETHIAKNKIDYIIQPFLTHPIELAIMYYRMPDENHSTVISVCEKKFLSITGDGRSTVEQLIKRQDRAVLQFDKLKTKYQHKFNFILKKGQVLELEPIGNHSRGTMFINANHIIDDSLHQVIHDIAKEMDGIYFGRFDLKCESIEALKKGEGIAIMELNGVGAEPAHIYDPSYSLWNTYKTLLNQWSIMHRIARFNRKQHNVPYPTLKEMVAYWKNLKAYKTRLTL